MIFPEGGRSPRRVGPAVPRRRRLPGHPLRRARGAGPPRRHRPHPAQGQEPAPARAHRRHVRHAAPAGRGRALAGASPTASRPPSPPWPTRPPPTGTPPACGPTPARAPTSAAPTAAPGAGPGPSATVDPPGAAARRPRPPPAGPTSDPAEPPEPNWRSCGSHADPSSAPISCLRGVSAERGEVEEGAGGAGELLAGSDREVRRQGGLEGGAACRRRGCRRACWPAGAAAIGSVRSTNSTTTSPPKDANQATTSSSGTPLVRARWWTRASASTRSGPPRSPNPARSRLRHPMPGDGSARSMTSGRMRRVAGRAQRAVQPLDRHLVAVDRDDVVGVLGGHAAVGAVVAAEVVHEPPRAGPHGRVDERLLRGPTGGVVRAGLAVARTSPSPTAPSVTLRTRRSSLPATAFTSSWSNPADRQLRLHLLGGVGREAALGQVVEDRVAEHPGPHPVAPREQAAQPAPA